MCRQKFIVAGLMGTALVSSAIWSRSAAQLPPVILPEEKKALPQVRTPIRLEPFNPSLQNPPFIIQAPSGQPANRLPIKKVVLFSSGVAYMQREGEVEGDARIDLSFPASDVNDLLKSLTIQDMGGGTVQAVGYDSRDPVERTLRSFAIDLANNPSQAQILDQVRGEKVEVILTGASYTGSIVGVESKTVVDKDKTTTVEHLNLLTADGLRSIKLADVQQVKFLNPILEGELKKALETLALSKDKAKKVVGVKFKGAGKRQVRVSYVVESPVWKTSYRLVLDKDGKPFLQGWAVVENPSDEDWSEVRMALVSGRPISFRMDLYSPLYVPRPIVEPELFASLRPPTYEGPMDRKAGEVVAGVPATPQPAEMPGEARKQVPSRLPSAGLEGGAAGREMLRARRGFVDVDGAVSQDLNLGQGVVSAAHAAQLGDYFQYTIDDLMSVARQKSALIPIVNKEVDGNRVSIFNPRAHAKYALLGLRFKNVAGMSLMQGPVTVFDGASYAGDARLPDLQAGEERLLSYAVDLGTEVEMKPKGHNGRIVMVTINKGILTSTTKERNEVAYNAVNRSKTDRTLLIEHPYRSEFKLASDVKPLERARDMYRFEVKLAAGKSAELPVIEERDVMQQIAITNFNSDQFRFYLSQSAISDKVKAALAEALKLQTALQQTRQQLQTVQQQLTAIGQDQERLRKNLKEMPTTAAAYKRYLEKFDQQETQIEKFQAEQKRLQETEQQQRQAFDGFLANLTVS